jgi:uncharacterized membrane protein YgdD (TMEM256/DUF423 family)
LIASDKSTKLDINMNQPKLSKAASGRGWIVAGALLACLAVILGSIGAHGLEKMIGGMNEVPKRIENWNTGVRYQMYHALALVLIGVISNTQFAGRLLSLAGWLMLVGVLLFSGCLYGWVFFDNRTLVMIVPLGGLAWIIGWLSLGVGVLISGKDTHQNA